MDLILQFDLNIFAIVLLLALLIVIYSKHERHNLKSRLFTMIISTTILMLALEILGWVFDGKSGDLNFYLNWIFNFFFTALNTVVVSLWASYIDYLVYGDEERLKRRMYYFLPTMIVVVLSIVNIFTPILFEISTENIYSRLPFIWVSIIFTVIIYVFVFGIIIKNRKRLNTMVIVGVMTFLLLPIIATLVQLSTYGLLLIWPSTAVALIFSYLIFETTSSNRDFLTGVFTRSRAEEAISGMIKRKRKFSVIMIDIDDFKILNDTFGHNMGDRALIELAIILKRTFNKKAIVSRFGGDEFIIVTEETLDGTIQFYRKEIQRFISQSVTNELNNMRFSFGVAYCTRPEKCTVEDIIVTADNNMYLDKAKNKNLKRRRSDE